MEQKLPLQQMVLRDLDSYILISKERKECHRVRKLDW